MNVCLVINKEGAKSQSQGWLPVMPVGASFCSYLVSPSHALIAVSSNLPSLGSAPASPLASKIH